MSSSRLMEDDARVLLDIIGQGDTLVNVLQSDMTPDEMLCQICTLLSAFEGSTAAKVYMLSVLDREHAKHVGATDDIQASEYIDDEAQRRLADLQQEAADATEALWGVMKLVLAVERSGINSWGTRTVDRHLDLVSGIPVLRVRVSSAEDDDAMVFDSQESTYAFLRNASGLLYSVKETYRNCGDRCEALPKFLLHKDTWALGQIMSVIKDLCELRGVDFDRLCLDAKQEKTEGTTD